MESVAALLWNRWQTSSGIRSSPAHSFRTLLNELGTIVRNTCRRRNADASEATFDIDTTPNAKQRAALDLVNTIRL